jgi:hypothetical protein
MIFVNDINRRDLVPSLARDGSPLNVVFRISLLSGISILVCGGSDRRALRFCFYFNRRVNGMHEALQSGSAQFQPFGH